MVNRNSESNFLARGFTLVELLVVISIMAALTALMLPRLRTVNKDRGIREAARVVGSKFAEASDRARRDGKASVTLVRNSNMVTAADVNGEVKYAASTIYISRAVPNFVTETAQMTGVFSNASLKAGDFRLPRVSGNGVVRVQALNFDIPTPLEQVDPDFGAANENVIRVGDAIRLSSSPSVSTTVAYRIIALDYVNNGDTLRIWLDAYQARADLAGQDAIDSEEAVARYNQQTPRPSLQESQSYSFVIERQPKILRSSITDLPPGYIIDLRLSGPLVTMEAPGNTDPGMFDSNGIPMNIRPLFYEKMKAVADGTVMEDSYDRIDIFFDSTGAISSVRTYMGDWDNPGTAGSAVEAGITGPLQLFITPTQLEENASPLYSDSNLWVTISNTSGGVNIGYNNPPLTTVDSDGDNNIELFELLTDARKSANTGRSASQ